MVVVWDPETAAKKLETHAVRFSYAETVLFNPNALTREDMEFEGEQRFVTGEMDAGGYNLIVGYIAL